MVCNPHYEDAAWAFYRYVPSTWAPIVFAVLFGITTLLHAFQMIKTKTWYLGAFLTGGICEVIGYSARTVNAMQDPGCWTLGPYVIQNIFLLIAPAFMAASIYMILGRIILLTDGEAYAVIRRRWSTKLFVGGDVLSLLMQSSGGGIMASGENMMEIGEYVVIAGLFVQLFVFGFFVVNAGIFHRRMALVPTVRSQDPKIRWKWYLVVLYVTSALIWIRSLFRVIEYIDGNKGYLMTTEAFIYAFDAALIFIVMVWMNWFHPSEIKMLLRGEEPIVNGLELMKAKRSFGKIESTRSSSEDV